MWRNEERLEFWLSGGKSSPRKGHAAWLRRLQIRGCTGDIRELPLEMECRLHSPDDGISINAKVLDGLEKVDLAASSGEEMSKAEISCAKVHCCDLLGGAAIRGVPIPDAHRARVVQKVLTLHPNLQSSAVEIGSGAIHALELLEDSPSSVIHFEQLSLQDSAIQAHTQISDLPYRRESAGVQQVSDAERKSFLHEAEVLKLVPSERAELLAIFRHVPIEMISRLRFLADRNEIRYGISGEPKRTQTRVHDMAVIRDTVSEEIHLVPHRTKSRLVSLA